MLRATIVDACLRDGRGGSPTAVLPEASLDDAARRGVPRLAGTSHAVFTGADGALRFFTAAGELPACGHGTLAALALGAQATSAAFDTGVPEIGRAPAAARELAATALAIAPDSVRLARIGRDRLLVQVADADTLWEIAPDLGLLREGCRGLDLLGVYVHTPPGPDGALAARMFAPAIRVPEDIANANSTACLAAELGRPITVDMGDALGTSAQITATPQPGGSVRIAGAARIRHTFWMGPDGYVVSTDPDRLDLERIHANLAASYWSPGIPQAVVTRSVANSVSFGLYTPAGAQVGFARVVSDRATYAYLADVYVEAAHQGQALGKLLVASVVDHPELQDLKRWALATADAHGLYARHGFGPPARPELHMFAERPAAELWPPAEG